MSEPLVTVLDWLAAVCLLLGAALSLVAGVGLVRFPDLLSRMHTAAKPQVLGLLLVLVGIGLRIAPHDTGVFNVGTLILVGLFQVMTVPVAGHIAARVAYRTGRIREDLLARDELADRIAERRGGGAEGSRGA
ncbi:Na+/H+ antiporter subunit G [Nocardiopsis sp. CNR-923]|uniref:monovalent cation/H(+) antiporter subunit G n=1 Tax=Nocardiopsis sp. CNR-923 TaxID=1904965 RepID=UPI00095DF19B|nr:monovalent cation/H(+) antiporter subunit G [Nocardiopsis sp. CNR-923]OLT26147.1 Na+/H+ antiporter subunit G [Nocardiopsis sp. CNR-923]